MSVREAALSATVIPGLDLRSADAYLAIEILSGRQFFLLRDFSFVTQARPIIQQWTPAAFRGDLVTHAFNAIDPGGGYMWLGFFTEPGSLIPIGCVGRASFTFSP